MKYVYLLLAIIALLFSLYFFYERTDLFVEIFNGRPLSQIPLGELLKPIILAILGIFFIYIYRKQPSKTPENEN
jgi:hypothetical protein